MVAGCDVLAGLLRLQRYRQRCRQRQRRPPKKKKQAAATKSKRTAEAMQRQRQSQRPPSRFAGWGLQIQFPTKILALAGGSVHRLASCWLLWRRILNLVKSDAYATSEKSNFRCCCCGCGYCCVAARSEAC